MTPRIERLLNGDHQSAAPSKVVVESEERVRWLLLNRLEKRNALDPELIDELGAAIADADSNPNVYVIVLAGIGTSFCAGADLHYLQSTRESGGPLPFLRMVSKCCEQLSAVNKPVVAAVHGHVVAGGLELALVCDVVIAESGTLIGDGHVRMGLLPAAGSSVRLPRRVGESLARWLIVSGELAPAECFVPTGFVHSITAPGALSSAARALCNSLLEANHAAQVAGKRLLERVLPLDLTAGLVYELDAFERHWMSASMPELNRFTQR